MSQTKSNKLKVRIVYQVPSSLGFGGGHVQAWMYERYANDNEIDVRFLDFKDKGDDFDILHILGLQAGNCLNAVTAKKKGKKVVVSPVFYTEADKFLYKVMTKVSYLPIMKILQTRFYLMQEALNAADIILPNSEAELKQLLNIFKIDHSKARVLYNGVEENLFADLDRDLILNRFNLKKGFLLCVANINKRKNTLSLIKAFLQTGINAKLVLIGDYNLDSDNDYCKEVEKVIGENGDKIIRIEGLEYGDPVIKSAYANAAVHCLPSVIETPGLANLEAGLAGCRLVVGDCPPVREYFGSDAIYCDPYDESDIKEKIITAYKSVEPNSVKDLVVKKYTWEQIGGGLNKIYRSL